MSSRMSSSGAYPRGVSLAVPPAYATMQAPPGSFSEMLMSRSKLIAGTMKIIRSPSFFKYHDEQISLLVKRINEEKKV